jgi:hypothetical protein
MHFFNYCVNPSCSNHRGLAGWTDRPYGQGAPRRCPLCRAAIVYTEYDDPVFVLPEIVIRGSPTPAEAVGVVIDTVPYGGHALRLGDDDAAHRFAGADHPDDTGRHIAELKHDLMLLGYYISPRFRAVERASPGAFHMHLLGAVVAFKYDLLDVYGVGAEVSPTPPADSGSLTVQTVGAIQYDRSIQSPYHPHFAPLSRGIIGQRTRQGLMAKLQAVKDRWDSRQGWKTTTDAARSRHSGEQPYIQPAVPTARLRELVDDRPGQARDLSDVLRALIETEGLAPVGGEPDLPDVGQPLDARGLEPIAQLEPTLAEALALCDAVCTEIDAWDQGGEGRAQTLRGEVERLRGEARPPRSLRDYEARLSSWETYRDGWRQVRLKVRMLVGRTRAYVLQHISSFIAYRNALIHSGTVDIATAVYIKHMLLHRTLPSGSGERGVFVCPTNSEIEDLPPGQTIEQLVEARCALHDVPFPIMRESVQHESGASQATTISGLMVPTYGVDWNNEGLRLVFDEVLTRAEQWRWSCGWGATQFTTFSGEAGGFDHRRGIPVTQSPEPPVPPYIRSIVENVDIGVRKMREKFDQIRDRRECTFTQRFDCVRCLTPSRFGCTSVNDLADLFKPVNRAGEPAGQSNQFSFYLNISAEQMAALFGVTVEPAGAIGPRIEWPCSRLAAKMHYGGSGPQAWQGLLRTIKKIASLATPAEPPTEEEEGEEE